MVRSLSTDREGAVDTLLHTAGAGGDECGAWTRCLVNLAVRSILDPCSHD